MKGCDKICPLLPPSSRGPGRSPFKAKTRVRISVGAPGIIELLDLPVEQFLALIRFDDQDALEKVQKLTDGE